MPLNRLCSTLPLVVRFVFIVPTRSEPTGSFDLRPPLYLLPACLNEAEGWMKETAWFPFTWGMHGGTNRRIRLYGEQSARGSVAQDGRLSRPVVQMRHPDGFQGARKSAVLSVALMIESPPQPALTTACASSGSITTARRARTLGEASAAASPSTL